MVYPINIAAEEEHIRWRSLQYLSRAIEIAAELGCGRMLLTPGWGYVESGRENKFGLFKIPAIGNFHGKETRVAIGPDGFHKFLVWKAAGKSRCPMRSNP